MSLKYNEEFKYALRDIANNSFKLESQFGIVYVVLWKLLILFFKNHFYTNFIYLIFRQSSLYWMGA